MGTQIYFWAATGSHRVGEIVSRPYECQTSMDISERAFEYGHFLLSSDPDSFHSWLRRIYKVVPLKPVTTHKTETRKIFENLLLGRLSDLNENRIKQLEASYWSDRPEHDYEGDIEFRCEKFRIEIAFDMDSDLYEGLKRFRLGHSAPAHAKEVPTESDMDTLIEDAPYQFVGKAGRRYLVTSSAKAGANPVYSFIPVSAKREKDIRDLKLSMRQAFLHSGTPIYLSADLASFSPWTKEEMGDLHVPRKGYRYYARSKSQEKSFQRKLAQMMKTWNF